MQREGIVIGEDNGNIRTLVYRESGCGSNCNSCGGSCSERQPIIISTPNDVGAKTGDKVLLSMKNGSVFKNSMIMYFIPLIFFVFGTVSGIIIFSGNNVTNYEIKAFLLGVVFLLLSLLVLKAINKKMVKDNKNEIKIIKIINLEEE